MTVKTNVLVGLLMGIIAVAVYGIVVYVSILFTGLPNDQLVLNLIAIYVFSTVFLGFSVSDSEFSPEVTERERTIYLHLDNLLTIAFVIPIIAFCVGSVFQGIIYTIQTVNIVGLIAIIILNVLVVPAGFKEIKSIDPYEGTRSTLVIGILLVNFLYTFPNGVMRSLTTLSMEAFFAISAITALIVIPYAIYGFFKFQAASK